MSYGNVNLLRGAGVDVVFQTQVQNLVEWVKEHEDYNGELQEVEKWLLQMSSRMVSSDSMQTSGMEMATQQLARYKVTFTALSDGEKKI